MFQPGTRIANPYRGLILERVDRIPEGPYQGQPGYLVWWCLVDSGVTNTYNEPYKARADDALQCPENREYKNNLGWVLMDKLHTHFTDWDGVAL